MSNKLRRLFTTSQHMYIDKNGDIHTIFIPEKGYEMRLEEKYKMYYSRFMKLFLRLGTCGYRLVSISNEDDPMADQIMIFKKTNHYDIRQCVAVTSDIVYKSNDAAFEAFLDSVTKLATGKDEENPNGTV